jgi:cobalt-zinc-cadmium efflux system protein
MDHHHHHTSEKSTKNIRLVFLLNIGFAVIELAGGLITNSISILSDAFHDFGDSISLGISWALQKVSKRGRDKRYSYGYRRFSLLGALFLSIVLIVGSIFIIKESIERIITPDVTDAKGMLLLAVLGITVNGFAAFKMKKAKSFNERALFLHIMEDVLGWVAVFVAGVVMLFIDVPWIDPVLSVVICVWVLSNVYKNLKGTMKVFLQEIPEDVDVEALEAAILSLPGVLHIHDMHLWTLDGEQHIMTLHVVTDLGLCTEYEPLKKNIREICDRFEIHHVTIEFETDAEKCTLNDCIV